MTINERKVWQAVFCNPQGEAVLADILNKLGYFSTDQRTVAPEKIAVANWMLSRLGVMNVENITTYMHAVVQTASMNGTEDRGEKQ
jgi:hypothetical protein